MGGAYASEGVVEINLHHTWAQFCSARMEQGLAETICRQLGYTNVLRYTYIHTLILICTTHMYVHMSYKAECVGTYHLLYICTVAQYVCSEVIVFECGSMTVG